MLIGFLTGVGIQVAIGQVGGMLGIGHQGGGVIENLVRTLAAIPSQASDVSAVAHCVPTELVSG